MTTVQKVIKYFAIALAVFLIVNIVSAIMYGLYGFVNILGLINHETEQAGTIALNNIDSRNIKELEIDIQYTNLIIKNGESFYIETDNENISCKEMNNTIQIKEKNKKWFHTNENVDLVIYVPQKFEFENVKITAGAGKLDIETMITQELVLEIGAGEAKIENLVVRKEAEVEGGAGKITIESGEINNLDLDMGIGKVEINTQLTGKSQINSGVGNLDITVKGEKDDFKIKINKGLGSVKLDGEECADGEVHGKGKNEIELDGGIGNINIDFEK